LTDVFNKNSSVGVFKTWKWITLFLTAFLICTVLRLIDIPAYQPSLQLPEGVPLMQNSDSYAWLSGAKRINQYSASPLSVIVRVIHNMTGLDIGVIGFWLPAVMAPLVVIPVFLLAAWWRLPEAALVAGVMSGSSFGFLLRTQMGWFDTDLYTLFFPVCIAACLIIWLEPLLRVPRGHDKTPDRRKVYAGAFFLGILFRIYFRSYPSGEVIGLSLLVCAALTGLIFAKKGLRYDIAISMLIILIAGDGAVQGLVIASGIVFLAVVRTDFFINRKASFSIGIVLAVVFLLSFDLSKKFTDIWFHISRYGKISSDAAALKLPSTINTVGEAQSVSMKNVVKLMSCNWVLLILGIAGYEYCVWRRPSAIIFSPLLILGLLSTRLGWRFTMYGGVVMGIGLGFGIVMILRSLGLKTSLRWIIQLVLLVLVLLSIRNTMTTDKTAMFLTKEYAQTLQELRAAAAPDAQIWNWWDWGYAAQYFAERMTFADGSRNTGDYTVPLARVHFTSSPLYAYRLIAFTANLQKSAGPVEGLGAAIPQYPNPFKKLLQNTDPRSAQDLMEGMESQAPGNRKIFPVQYLPEQYLIISWYNLGLSKDISTFGTWNLATGTSSPGNAVHIKGKIDFDMQKGLLFENYNPLVISTADFISEHGTKHLTWPENKKGIFIVRNETTGSTYSMDESIYNSLMVQMLIREPKAFDPYFKLVIDHLPFVRVYRLNTFYHLTDKNN